MPEQLRLMAVHAHPDDESSKGAATMARYVAEGVDVLVVTCTGGERGDILNPALKDDPDVLRDMAEVRRREMAQAAAEILGVEHDWLGFVDSGLPEGDPLPPLPEGCFALEPLEDGRGAAGPADPRVPPARDHDLRRERRLPAPRPHHVPQGLGGGVRGRRRPGPLPGRRRAVAAAEALLRPRLQPGADRRPARGDARRRARVAVRRVARATGTTSPSDRPSPVTTRVECADYFAIRDRALLAHATQIDPDGLVLHGPAARCSAGSGRPRTSSWPAAWSTAPLPEDDLFAGVRERVGV